MTQYREILRLKYLGFSERNIARSCPCSRNTVAKVLEKATELKLSWPLADSITDDAMGSSFQKQLQYYKSAYQMWITSTKSLCVMALQKNCFGQSI